MSSDTARTDVLLSSLLGLRKAGPRPEPKSTPRASRFDGWSGVALKAEAIRLQPLTGKSKSACAREFGVVRETMKDWLDPINRPRSFPPEDFVEWLACHVDARSLVRVA